MEPLSHYHCEIYCCKPVPINLHQTTCTNNNQPCINLYHASTCTSKQPVINLYHKQVHQPCTNLYQTTCNQHTTMHNLYLNLHQPCTKYVPIMHQIHINYDSSRCTNIINYTPHVCANSSTTCLNHVPNMYLNQNPSSISSSKSDL
jgi:hypothetical protein